MLTLSCNRLRGLSRLVASRRKGQCYVYTHWSQRVLTFSIILRELRNNCIRLKCWKCGCEIRASSLICSRCNTLQKPDQSNNYFDVFGIKEGFEVEDRELRTKYRKLQNVLHPDRFSGKNAEEREISKQYSALVNKAYAVLLQPLARGLYMLQLHGKNLEDTTETDPQFLADIMETNEELAMAQNPDDVRRLENVNKSMIDKLTREVANAFSAGNLDAAKEGLIKMQYYASIGERIKDLKQKTGIE